MGAEETLAALGIDPRYVVEYGVPAAERAGGGARAHDAVTALAQRLHALGVELWSPFRSSVPALALACQGDGERFARALESLGELVAVMQARGVDPVLTLQQGVPPLGHAAVGKPWAVLAGLELARDLASRGLDPKETLRQGLPALVPYGEGEVHRGAPSGRPEFVACVAILGEALATLAAGGVGPHWPILAGVAAIAGLCRGDRARFERLMRELVALGLSLKSGPISPYPVIEYGVGEGLKNLGEVPWLADEALPLASALAAQGVNPHETLQLGVPALASVEPAFGREALAWALALALDGVDPGAFLGGCLVPLFSCTEDPERRRGLLERSGRLLRALAAHGRRQLLAIREGLPGLFEFSPEEVLDLAIELAPRTDPGPCLAHGVRTAAEVLRERPEDGRAVVAAARRLVRAGLDPWYFCQHGVLALVDVARDDGPLFRALVVELEALTVTLHELGQEPGRLLLYAIRPLARSLRGDAPLFRAFTGGLRELVSELRARGIDPGPSVCRGLPAVAEVAPGPAAVERAVALTRRLAAGGVDPSSLLERGLPALVRLAGADVAALDLLVAAAATLWEALAANGRAPGNSHAETIAHVSAAAEGRARPVALALAFGARVAKTLDPGPLLADAVPSLVAALREDETALEGALAELERWLDRVQGEGLDLEAATAALPGLIAAMQPRAAREEWPLLLDGLGRALTALRAGGVSAATTLAPLARACALVGAGRASVVIATLEGALGRVLAARVAGADVPLLAENVARIAARVAGAREGVFLDLLAAGEPLARRQGATAPLLSALGLASRAARDDAGRFAASLAALVRIAERGLLRGEKEDELGPILDRLGDLVDGLPEAWADLILPLMVAQGVGAPRALAAIVHLKREIKDEAALGLLRTIVTQQGVRAPDILFSLVLGGVRDGSIGSLGGEAATLLAFLEDMPLADPNYYAAYKRLLGDALAPTERRARVKALRGELDTLSAAIVRGEIDAEAEKSPLLPQVLAYVFPPAYTVGRTAYVELVRRFPDHVAHTAALHARGAAPEATLRLAQGGWRVRPDSAVVLAPWEPIAKAAVGAREDRSPVELGELGAALFAAWTDGELRKESLHATLLRDLVRAGGQELPDLAPDPSTLLALREFVADDAREVIQAALRAHREADPVRYAERARAKLSPPRKVGQGLARVVGRTVAAARAGELEGSVAVERVERQLKGFELGSRGAAALLELDEASLAVALAALAPAEVRIEIGQEHLRIHSDLFGPELAAMERELFGAQGATGKLEHHAATGPALELRLQPTKRRAHSPVGFSEGVCTATDDKLWDDPRFIQTVIWGADGRCRGGIHLLVVGDEKSGEWLALPGINPSLDLLQTVGPKPFLDAALEWARGLAASMKLKGVWIPTHAGIVSNRAAIRDELEQRGDPVKQVATVEFSYSPYRYTFAEVRELAL